ncbi:MAG: radical SAM protein [Nitrospirae bacterium]|nr:radical SAM protein [Nitrospirota bacterium]
MAKLLFITPPYHAGVVEVAGKWVPLYLVTIAGSAIAAGHDAAIYDSMTKDVGFDEIAEKIREYKPDYVLCSVITSTCPDAIKVFELAKGIDPAITTIAGGIHASFMYEEMFATTSALDYVVIGEGEVTLVELLDCLSNGGGVSSVKGIAYRDGGGIAKTGKRGFIHDLDSLPFAWDLLDWRDYTYFILPGSRLGAIDTSRGCDKDCTFCSQQKFWERSWRARSPEAIVAEMETLKEKHGVDVILFTDDYPTPDRARWERLLDLLIERDLGISILMETRAGDIIRDRDILDKYRRAGIIHIYVGTEATDQATLNLLKKDLSIEDAKEALRLCREHNIITETSMILGFPDDTPESMARTIELAKEYNPDFAHFLAIAPWPYSDIYPELKPFIEESDYRKYNLIDPILKPRNMTREDVDRAIVTGYRKFYMGKFMEMLTSGDEFKRRYMLSAMQRMMNNSFIKKKLGMLGGEMPEEIRKIVYSGHPMT